MDYWRYIPSMRHKTLRTFELRFEAHHVTQTMVQLVKISDFHTLTYCLYSYYFVFCALPKFARPKSDKHFQRPEKEEG